MAPKTKQQAILAFRILLAGLLAAHGWARLLSGGVEPFGVFLSDQGFPLGSAIAWGITIFEIAGTVVADAGRFVPLLSLVFAAIYTVGIILVHMSEGWFVVGLGRNGVEYSVLLIFSLLFVGLHHLSTDSGIPPQSETKDTDN